ncbi:TPA: hypothetical protein ACX6S2_003434 [Photobacterium damselae]
MGHSQKKHKGVDLLPQIVDLDELLRFLVGATNDDDVCMRGISVSLQHAKQLSAKIRKELE